VIAIIAVVSVVVVLTLNPAELLRQSRDANRLSDMATVSAAVNLYLEDSGGTGTLGTASTSYISVADPSATSTNQCQGLGLPALATSSGQNWQCAASSTVRKVDSTGWIPLSFSTLSIGSPVGQLSVDPINQTSTNLFYSYSANGTQYAVTAILESQKYKQAYGTMPPSPFFPEVIVQGNTPSVSVLYSPTGLVGYWNFDEGSGSTTIDRSGSGNNGTWQGGSSYVSGKVGTFAANFNGSNYIAMSGTSSVYTGLANISVSIWYCSAAPAASL
jgi:hypothetical protein